MLNQRALPDPSRPRIAPRTAPWTLYRSLLGQSGAEALPTIDQTQGASWVTLDAIGVQVIAEQLATGRLPVEVALLYEVPILHFRRWMRERIPDEVQDEIRAAAAESLQVKAMLTLSARLSSPAEASQAKALSERFARISEALSPKDWNPARVEAPGDVPSITITFNGMALGSPTGAPAPGSYARDVTPHPAASPLDNASRSVLDHGASPMFPSDEAEPGLRAPPGSSGLQSNSRPGEVPRSGSPHSSPDLHTPDLPVPDPWSIIRTRPANMTVPEPSDPEV